MPCPINTRTLVEYYYKHYKLSDKYKVGGTQERPSGRALDPLFWVPSPPPDLPEVGCAATGHLGEWRVL
jgi:hypothetical protein